MRIQKNHNIYWFRVFLILYSGKGISLFNRDVFLIAIIILLGISFCWMIKNRISFIGVKRFMIPWTIYCLVSFVYFKTFHPLFFILLPITFFSVYVLIKSKLDLKIILSSYDNIIINFAKISLFFFSWQLVNSSSLISLFSFFDFNIGKSYNAIVYTIHHRSISDGIARNAGFCWEPGPFACFLVIGLVVHLLKNKFNLNARIVVYIITILSTASSTGYFCLGIITVWYFYIKSRKYFLLVLPIIISLTILFISKTDDFNNKILPQFFNAEKNIEFYSKNRSKKQTSIGRFDGFLLNLIDLKRHPVIGFGGHRSETFSQLYNLRISSTSGLGNWLAQYGIIGFIILIFCLFKSSFLVTNLFYSKGVVFLFFIYLGIIFSFNLITTPVFTFFIFMGFINDKKIKNT